MRRGALLLAVAAIGCRGPEASPPPAQDRALAYVAPSPVARAAAAGSAWRVALPALPGDVAPAVAVATTGRARAAVPRPEADRSVPLTPPDRDERIDGLAAFFGDAGDWSGGYGLRSAPVTPTGTIGVGDRSASSGQAGQLGGIGVGGRGLRLRVAEAVIGGALPEEIVRRLLLRASATVVACLGGQPATFDVRGVIGQDGAVTSATGSGSAAAALPCVLDAVKAVTFPGGEGTTQFRVSLSAARAAP